MKGDRPSQARLSSSPGSVASPSSPAQAPAHKPGGSRWDDSGITVVGGRGGWRGPLLLAVSEEGLDPCVLPPCTPADRVGQDISLTQHSHLRT